ncbi:MAG TPA: hypothetical protein V6C76_13090 [Drouetiella sp.]
MAEIQKPVSTDAFSDDSAHRRLLADAQQANPSLIDSAVDGVVSMVWSGDSDAKKTTETVISGVVKNAPLFMGGAKGILLTDLSFGLAEVKTNDSLSQQGFEFLAGAGKGALTKFAFHHIGNRDWGVAAKGMAMGSSMRFIDTAFTPGNYSSNGQQDIAGGVDRAIHAATKVDALGIDALTFGAARFVPGVLPQQLAENAFVSRTALGGVTGFTSGVLGEVENQISGKEKFDFGNILMAGGRDAAIMSASAAVGHGLTSPELRTSTNDVGKTKLSVERPETTDGAEKTLLPASKSGYVGYFLDSQAIDKVQNNLVVEGQRVAMPWNPPSTFHITSKFGINSQVGADWIDAAAKTTPELKVIGIATDNTGVQALHVSVDGESLRGDGHQYHITRSLADGRKAYESIDTIDKALKVKQFKESGAASGADFKESTGVDFEDIDRYIYKPLAPQDQFVVSAEPRYKETDTTPAKRSKNPK